MFQFPGFPAQRYGFTLRSMILHHRGFPIRKSADRSLFAAPRSLSQLVASFIGSWCQGIHHVLLFAWTFHKIFRSMLFSELLEFHKQIFIGIHIAVKGLSFCLHWIVFHLSGDLFHRKVEYSTFRWNCNLNYPLWKDQIFLWLLLISK